MKTFELDGVTLFVSEETASAVEYELAGGLHGEMARLAKAWLEGDDLAGDIWSDLWKDAYGCRPRYTRDEVRRMYGLS